MQYMDDFYESIGTSNGEVEQILTSRTDPVTKVRRIMALGIEEDDANDIVERYQIGQLAPVYYERLDFGQADERVEAED